MLNSFFLACSIFLNQSFTHWKSSDCLFVIVGFSDDLLGYDVMVEIFIINVINKFGIAIR